MTTPLVEANGIERSFRLGGQTVHALRPASFRVLPGDRIALAGPSGSGKSTLLQLMADLDTPSAGTLAWPALGPSGTLRPEKIGMVFQASSLLPMLDLAENVALPLLLAGRAEGSRERALRALESIGLASLADKLPEELSGGQAQRVGIARALVARPKLILADEPTGQLDSLSAQRVLDALLAALEGSDAALVVSTHDRSVAARLRSTWRMDHGTLQTEARPATEAVA